jgi:hypothetical protein
MPCNPVSGGGRWVGTPSRPMKAALNTVRSARLLALVDGQVVHGHLPAPPGRQGPASCPRRVVAWPRSTSPSGLQMPTDLAAHPEDGPRRASTARDGSHLLNSTPPVTGESLATSACPSSGSASGRGNLITRHRGTAATEGAGGSGVRPQSPVSHVAGSAATWQSGLPS